MRSGERRSGAGSTEIRNEIFPKNKKIMGASVRVEYSYLRDIHRKVVNGHPVQPEAEELIYDIESCMKKWECEYCFLAIDDEDTLNIVKERLGSKCIYMKRWRRNYEEDKRQGTDPDYYYISKLMKNTITERGIDYLTELLLLAQCDCFLAGKSSGNIFAYLKNDRGYEYVCIYEKGEIRIE